MKTNLLLIFTIFIFSSGCTFRRKIHNHNQSFNFDSKISKKISQTGNSCLIHAIFMQHRAQEVGLPAEILVINYEEKISHAVLFFTLNGRKIIWDDNWGETYMNSNSKREIAQEWSSFYGITGYPKKISSYAFID